MSNTVYFGVNDLTNTATGACSLLANFTAGGAPGRLLQASRTDASSVVADSQNGPGVTSRLLGVSAVNAIIGVTAVASGDATRSIINQVCILYVQSDVAQSFKPYLLLIFNSPPPSYEHSSPHYAMPLPPT